MKRWLIALTWLLSLALPLQGLAAALPSIAPVAMHGAMRMAGMPAMHGADEAAPPCHESAVAQAIQSDSGIDDPAGCPACSACATCHGGSAPSPAVAAAAVADAPRTAPPAWRAPAALAIVPDAIEHPPRSLDA